MPLSNSVDQANSTSRAALSSGKLQPPTSWLQPSSHFLKILEHPWYKLIFKLQSTINYHTFLFYQARNIYSASLPITTDSISSPMGFGSDSLPVRVTISGQQIYLADSMQFMLEYALRFYDKGVFYIAPSFRGEDADSRHLCQFYHSEAEICGTLDDIIALVEDYVKYLSNAILNSLKHDLESFGFNLSHIIQLINMSNFPRIRFEDALKLLGNKSVFISEHPAGFKIINNEGENQLTRVFSGPMWLTHLPQLAVPFYQADEEENSEFAKCADLIMGIGEIVGAGERHKNCEPLLNAMKKRRVEAEPYKWYIKMKEKHPMKTSGFGMGVERFILWLLEHNDIRDCQIAPRFNGVDFAL